MLKLESTHVGTITISISIHDPDPDVLIVGDDKEDKPLKKRQE